jgi:Ca2+-binding EF-hand superfamily protein
VAVPRERARLTNRVREFSFVRSFVLRTHHRLPGSRRRPSLPNTNAIDIIIIIMAPSSIDTIMSQLPGLDKDDATQKAARVAVFAKFDPNNNGYVSLAECEKGCRDVLGFGDLLPKPVVMRAYQAARGVSGGHGDYVEKSEFRLFLVYLQRYLELWQMFAAMDGSSSGVDDRRITYDEFQTSVPQLVQQFGITVDDPKATFDAMDVNGGGMVLFDEFSQWAMAAVVQKERDEGGKD